MATTIIAAATTVRAVQPVVRIQLVHQPGHDRVVEAACEAAVVGHLQQHGAGVDDRQQAEPCADERETDVVAVGCGR